MRFSALIANLGDWEGPERKTPRCPKAVLKAVGQLRMGLPSAMRRRWDHSEERTFGRYRSRSLLRLAALHIVSGQVGPERLVKARRNFLCHFAHRAYSGCGGTSCLQIHRDEVFKGLPEVFASDT